MVYVFVSSFSPGQESDRDSLKCVDMLKLSLLLAVFQTDFVHSDWHVPFISIQAKADHGFWSTCSNQHLLRES